MVENKFALSETYFFWIYEFMKLKFLSDAEGHQYFSMQTHRV